MCIGKQFLVIKPNVASSNARTHLLRIHHIDVDTVPPPGRLNGSDSGTQGDWRSTTPSLSNRRKTPILTPTPSGQYRSLTHLIKLDLFRNYLIRWVVEHHIPFTIIKDKNFRQMLLAINGSIKKHLVTGNTVH